jgi:transcriptional regulator with XRE-family HTH domain
MTAADASTFGAVLRRLRDRRGMTQRELAFAAATHATHLSRLESGDRSGLSRELLERLGVALDAEAELAAAAGRLTARLEAQLCRFPAGLAGEAFERRTLRSMRRAQAASVAQAILATIPGSAVRGRVDPDAVLRQMRLEPRTRRGTGVPVSIEGRLVTVTDPGGPDDPGAFPRVRFLKAHAAAHVALRMPECEFPRMSDAEQLACDVAVHLLCPSGLLDNALRDSARGGSGPWDSDPGGLIADVATRLGVPSWLAVRRLADEALLEDDALYYTVGDQ